jgi:hypothetical protein
VGYRNRVRKASMAGRNHVKGSDANRRRHFSVDWAVVWQIAQEEVQVPEAQAMASCGRSSLTWQTYEPDTTDDHLDQSLVGRTRG